MKTNRKIIANSIIIILFVVPMKYFNFNNAHSNKNPENSSAKNSKMLGKWKKFKQLSKFSPKDVQMNNNVSSVELYANIK